MYEKQHVRVGHSKQIKNWPNQSVECNNVKKENILTFGHLSTEIVEQN